MGIHHRRRSIFNPASPKADICELRLSLPISPQDPQVSLLVLEDVVWARIGIVAEDVRLDLLRIFTSVFQRCLFVLGYRLQVSRGDRVGRTRLVPGTAGVGRPPALETVRLKLSLATTVPPAVGSTSWRGPRPVRSRQSWSR
jgi:hypothetical protein